MFHCDGDFYKLSKIYWCGCAECVDITIKARKTGCLANKLSECNECRQSVSALWKPFTSEFSLSKGNAGFS